MNLPAEQIAREIRRDGPMTLARFMELALYAPGCGYYERQPEIGWRGDFFTSVSVGPVFGELLAFQFAAWLETFSNISIVEAGAHQGRLAADILGWIERWRPDLLARLEYWLVEASPTRRSWQRRTLEPWLDRVRWIDALPSAPKTVTGMIFSNEFFDAFPTHRLGWDRSRGAWREWRVVIDRDKFAWSLDSLSCEAASELPVVAPELASVMPDQFTVEISPQAAAWWRTAAHSLGAGKIVTVDYGLTDAEWLRPERPGGTLRAYADHRVAPNALDKPGEQDLTAHVQFSALQRTGEQAGLHTDGLFRQDAFLTRIFAETQASQGSFPDWTRDRVRQFQTLTHPDHLGRSFRALLQSAKPAEVRESSGL